jgi:hypothetical protein
MTSIRRQAERNHYMDERSITAGESAEKAFPKAARAKSMEVERGSRHDERVNHIDFWMSPKGWRPNFAKGESMSDKPRWGIEVKAMKRISRADPRPQSEWLWVEFKNINGGEGWLYGKATFLAAETPEGFALINLKMLRQFAEERVDREAKVTRPQEARYRSYTRRNRADEMSLVRLSDFQEWYAEHTGRQVIQMPHAKSA